MGVEAAPPAQGSTHTPISAGETAGRVPGTLRPDAEPPVGELWEAGGGSQLGDAVPSRRELSARLTPRCSGTLAGTGS